eukprot:6074065-Pleurochrysis_carterae.AAC.1
MPSACLRRRCCAFAGQAEHARANCDTQRRGDHPHALCRRRQARFVRQAHEPRVLATADVKRRYDLGSAPLASSSMQVEACA